MAGLPSSCARSTPSCPAAAAVAQAAEIDERRDGRHREQEQDALAAGVGGDRRSPLEVGQRLFEAAERVSRAAVQPERGKPRGQLRTAEPLQRGGGLVQIADRVASLPLHHAGDDTGRQRRQQENRIADRARVLARVARLGARLAQVARDQCRHGQREPQADPVLGRLRRQLGQRDVQPSPRVLVAAHPQLHVPDRHRERQARVAPGRSERAEQRLTRRLGIARGGLGLGEQRLHAGPPLDLLRAVGQQPERGPVQACRGRGRRGLQLAGGRGEQRDRLLVTGHGCVLHVVSALHRPGATALERDRRPGMRAKAPAARRRRVHGVANHRVTEREPARDTGRAHERPREQLVERPQRRGLGELSHLGGQRRLEWIARDRGRVEHPARVGRQPGQLRRQRVRDCGRNRGVRRDVGARVRAARHARELLEIERVAPAQRVDRRGGRTDQLRRLGLVQRRRCEPGHAILAHRVRERRGERRGSLPLSERHGQQHRGGWRPAHQRRQRIDRCRIGPVHVVHAQNERANGREPLQQVAQRPVRAMAISRRRLAVGVGERRHDDAERTRVGNPKTRSPTFARLCQVGLERVRPQRVREVCLELGGAPPEHRASARLRARRELGEQQRLADPGLALHGEGAARPHAERLERRRDRLALAGAAHQRRRRDRIHDRGFSRSSGGPVR